MMMDPDPLRGDDEGFRDRVAVGGKRVRIRSHPRRRAAAKSEERGGRREERMKQRWSHND